VIPMSRLCAHCGLAHPSCCCNRPEGIEARGYVLRIPQRSIGWRAQSHASICRGGMVSARLRRRQDGAVQR
jgi:hypothetical protein